MGTDCSQSFAKFLLISINLLFLLASMLVLSLGLVLVIDPSNVVMFAKSHGLDVAILSHASNGLVLNAVKVCGALMIGAGLCILILSFIGLFGACYNSRCLLVTYAVMLGTIVLSQIGIIVVSSLSTKSVWEKGGEVLYRTLKGSFKSDVQVEADGKFDNSSLGLVDSAWMIVQVELQCCGARDYKDYDLFKWTRCGSSCPNNSKVPLSCCKVKRDIEIPQKTSDLTDVQACLSTQPAATNLNGCTKEVVQALSDLTRKYVNLTIGIISGVLSLELILGVLAIVKCCSDQANQPKQV